MITIANLLSDDLDPLARGVSSTLQAGLDIEVWLDRRATLADFRDGRICIALLCGLAYTLLHDADPERFQPAAVPVPDHEQGGDEPVYFSEIVVPAASPARSLPDLAGQRFVYNEAVSFSGYRALEHELRGRGLGWDFFGECVRTGSHGESMKRIADGTAGAAAIDSHVLRLKAQHDSGLADGIRVLASLGPYPAPLLAIHAGVCGVSPGKLRALLDGMNAGVLRQSGVRRWQPVDDGDYDAIRGAVAGLPGLGDL